MAHDRPVAQLALIEQSVPVDLDRVRGHVLDELAVTEFIEEVPVDHASIVAHGLGVDLPHVLDVAQVLGRRVPERDARR